MNIAESRSAWQSSNWDPVFGLASLSVDGIADPNWSAGSCSATKDAAITKPPVWAVDLGDLVDVYYVEIVNRAVYASESLSNV